MIDIQQATKLYKTVIGVNDVTLLLPPGTYGLLGPNGSGKTTLINLILGQIRPTLGSVKLFGVNPWRRSHLLRRIGLCPATDVSFPQVTALEWVAYLTQLHGFSFSESQRRAKQALERVQIGHAMHRPLREFSLGMRQRSKIAQAISHDPELLILDEPFNGLDPIGRHEMTEFLKSWRQEGKSLIMASHILYEVESVQPSFLLISGGRLLASGSPSEVREILADSPYTLHLRTNDVKRLARLLIEHCQIDSLQFQPNGGMTVSTLAVGELYNRLPSLLMENDIQVSEMTSTDDSLKSLFSTLMKLHRGELSRGINK
jgi:ABC-2 type transport system ATP-binding protein